MIHRTNWAVKNATTIELKLQDSTLDHGAWISTPPAVIAPGATVRFAVRSEGLIGRIEGTVTYESEAGALFSFYFRNPVIGRADFEVGEPEGYEVVTHDLSENDQDLTSRIVKLSDDD